MSSTTPINHSASETREFLATLDAFGKAYRALEKQVRKKPAVARPLVRASMEHLHMQVEQMFGATLPNFLLFEGLAYSPFFRLVEKLAKNNPQWAPFITEMFDTGSAVLHRHKIENIPDDHITYLLDHGWTLPKYMDIRVSVLCEILKRTSVRLARRFVEVCGEETLISAVETYPAGMTTVKSRPLAEAIEKAFITIAARPIAPKGWMDLKSSGYRYSEPENWKVVTCLLRAGTPIALLETESSMLKVSHPITAHQRLALCAREPSLADMLMRSPEKPFMGVAALTW